MIISWRAQLEVQFILLTSSSGNTVFNKKWNSPDCGQLRKLTKNDNVYACGCWAVKCDNKLQWSVSYRRKQPLWCGAPASRKVKAVEGGIIQIIWNDFFSLLVHALIS